MAVEFVTTVGITDYSFDWVAEEIIIETGVTDVSAADLKTAIHDAQDGTQGMYRNKIMTVGNQVVLTGTTSTFLNVVLQDGWKINSFSVSGTLTVGEGNVVSLADGIDIFASNPLVNFVNNTSAAGVLVVSGSGVTQQDKDDIEAQIFARIVEGGFSFEEIFRLIAASAAGTITQAGDGPYTISGIDAVTARILGQLAANNGRDITSLDGT